MARISNYSKEFVGADGSAPKNTLIIELLEKHGVAGKTASSTFPAELEKLVSDELKAMGYKHTGAGEASAASSEENTKKAADEEKAAAAPEKKEDNKAPAPQAKAAETVNAEAKAKAAEPAVERAKAAPAESPAPKQNAPAQAAAPKQSAPAQGQGQMPQKKKKSSVIIVTGGNMQQRPQGGAHNAYPGNASRLAGPQKAHDNSFQRVGGRIKPRPDMVDLAGRHAREAEEQRRLEEQRQLEAQKAAEQAEAAAKAAEQAAAAREAASDNTAPVRENSSVNTAPARSNSGSFTQNRGGYPQQQGTRPFNQGGQRPFGRDNGNGGNRPSGDRPAPWSKPGTPGQRPGAPGQRPGGFGQRPGAPGAGGRPGKPGAGRIIVQQAPPADSRNGDRRGRHNDKDRSREDRRNSSQFEDKIGNNRNSRAGAFQKPVAKKQEEVPEDDIKVITLPDQITIKEFAEKMRVNPSEIVKKLFLQSEMVTVNQEITFEKAEEIALDYEIMCEREEKVDVIAELLKEDDEEESKLVPRPPVICVMGHVDRGKTSLLDAIRKTHVTDREAGGITQHIGAYTVSIGGRSITFLDTPGHEAFTSMRMRGANSTDIAILVVAADDGVMPQTIEAINHAKAAGIEIIVAVNKIDKPGANVDRVKQELTEYELVSEDWGGSTIFCPVSAKSGEGIDNLLEMILLTADVLELKANPKRQARGLVIEAELDKGRGPVATVLVQKGTLHVGDFISAGASHGKVRAMVDDKGRRVKDAGPSTPVEILGLNDVPNAGEIFICHPNDKEAKSFADTFIAQNKEKLLEDTKAKMSLEDVFNKIQEGNLKELNLIIKADVQGSVEAVKQSLLKLSNDEVVVKLIHGGVGAINESDVVLASASNAIIIGFNVRPDAVAKQTADREGVDVRLYKVIYQAIEDIEAAMKGMLDPVYEEKIIGHAEVRQIFKASAIGNIAGSFVLDGEFRRDCKIRISREGEQIYEGSLASLKRFKDDVKEVKAGFECGLVFDGFDQMQELDQVEAYIMVEVPRT
ncbi:MAG: translation initiation factor IF-2 [Lachnospiraceae bacterium]|nr:translation initiation factor IF-2 [Lachnospiraceae bacterium]